ncbi:MAG: hypothetical protein WAK95_10800 [Desulfobacterales bacterium]
MNLLATVWFVFALMFSGLGIYHFGAASAAIGLFEAGTSPPSMTVDGLPAGPATDVVVEKRIQKFSAELNRYIAAYNTSTRQRNVMAGIGYAAAALTALLAMAIELKDFLTS